ncbi:MAG TPA: GGDEF domain-containing protein [Methylophilaceae bacterium]|jgi:diguanylate cyclase (GGDEF)-like protein
MQILSIDLKTMAFGAMSLTFILSLFLALVRQGTKYIQGPNYWALGSFSVCFGMAMLFFRFDSAPWMIALGPIFIIIGVGLFINGLQAFNNRQPDRRIPVLLAVVLGLVDWYFIIVQPNMRVVVAFDAILFAIAYFTAARMLMGPTTRDLTVIYRLNAALFFFMALFMLFRAYAALTARPEVFLAMSEWVVNQLTFLAFFVQQLCTTLSLTLMLHYRNMQILRELSTFDELTSALSRRGLENAATRVLSNCNRNEEPLSLLLIDVDRLKTINAKYSWALGDELLREFSKVIRETISAEDVFGRSGDDEFCLLLPGTTEQQAIQLARQILSNLELRLIDIEGQNTYATASIGMSHSEYVGLNYHDLLAAAQSAMYNAKELGRNTVVAHSKIHTIT